MKLKWLILFCCILLQSGAYAQFRSLRFQEEDETIKIPFEFRNNFIIVDVKINNWVPLKFILDTGSEHTIISKKEIAPILGLKYTRSINILGADLDKELIAYVAPFVKIQVGAASAPKQEILVLDEDYIQLDQYVGMQVQGILGANIFRGLVMKIDYQRKVISLRKKNTFIKGKKWQKIPAEIKKSKPYIYAKAKISGKLVGVKLLVDTGASLPILLYTNTNPDIQLPPETIRGSMGRGLGGTLEGYLGRLERLELGKFHFGNMITSYHDILATKVQVMSLKGRNGILGNVLLKRFKVVIDLGKQEIFLAPHRKKYNKGFRFDKSGIELIASGVKFQQIEVLRVIEGSPAEEAGVQKGDQIISVNYLGKNFLGLGGISKILSKKAGKSIRLKVKRKGEKKVFKFRLRELI